MLQGFELTNLSSAPCVCLPSSLASLPFQPDAEEESVSVLQPIPTPPATYEEAEPRSVVEWQPPHIDWNPWVCKSSITPGMKYSNMSSVSEAAGNSGVTCLAHSYSSCLTSLLQEARAAAHNQDLLAEYNEKRQRSQFQQVRESWVVCY